jgi:hypothetical protein
MCSSMKPWVQTPVPSPRKKVKNILQIYKILYCWVCSLKPHGPLHAFVSCLSHWESQTLTFTLILVLTWSWSIFIAQCYKVRHLNVITTRYPQAFMRSSMLAPLPRWMHSLRFLARCKLRCFCTSQVLRFKTDILARSGGCEGPVIKHKWKGGTLGSCGAQSCRGMRVVCGEG